MWAQQRFHSLSQHSSAVEKTGFLSVQNSNPAYQQGRAVAGLIVKQVSEFLLLHILINLQKRTFSAGSRSQSSDVRETSSFCRSPGIFPIGRKSAGTAETAQANEMMHKQPKTHATGQCHETACPP
ncbi:hypothetical protein CXT94_04180 [Akkermansia muciniphila]|nr:hypothetical protein CXT94_04180 [Akkermansia muciniphila]